MRVTLHAPALWRRHRARGPEDVVDLPDELAQGYLNAGVAILAGKSAPKAEPEPEPESEPEVEAAVIEPPENAAERTRPPVRRKKAPVKKKEK